MNIELMQSIFNVVLKTLPPIQLDSDQFLDGMKSYHRQASDFDSEVQSVNLSTFFMEDDSSQFDDSSILSQPNTDSESSSDVDDDDSSNSSSDESVAPEIDDKVLFRKSSSFQLFHKSRQIKLKPGDNHEYVSISDRSSYRIFSVYLQKFDCAVQSQLSGSSSKNDFGNFAPPSALSIMHGWNCG
jgi:hypothetical protein